LKKIQTYTQGHKFFNGMPMGDQFAAAIDTYCKYARQHGDLRSKDEISRDWQERALKKAGVIKFKTLTH